MAALGGRHRICKMVLLGRAALCSVTLAGKEVAEGGRAFSSSSSGGSGSGSSSRDKGDGQFESLFGEPPPPSSSPSPPGGADRARQRSTELEENIFSFSSGSSASKPTEASSGETDFWNSLIKKPGSGDGEKKQTSSSSSASSWDFLKELNVASTRPRSSQTQSSSHSSFRKLGDSSSGLDFLSEALDIPVSRSEPSAQESGEENILHSASFKLLRDSFQKASMQPHRETVGIKSLNEALGLDSGTLFSSQETWSKPIDSRTLAEVEGNFYSTLDHTPAEETKTYTYEELGEKLRQVRPPAEQQLFSATGLSFGELRVRLHKIEQMDNEAPEEDDALGDYKELRESLNHLRPLNSPKSLAARKQLSFEELAFLNTIGSRTSSRVKIEYTTPKDGLLTKYYSEEQLSSKERLELEIKKLRAEFQTHESDSGSPQVQIAIMTARINNLNRHLREGPNYKRDKHSRKGLNDMVQYRKRLLRYLRRRDWPVYCNVLTKLKLDDIILERRK